MKKQAGFTLIELVIVIIILGILAVTAAPKFLNLQDDAKKSAAQGVQAAVSSSAQLVYSKSALAGVERSSTAAVSSSDGTNIAVVYGYPAATSAGIQNAVTIDGSWKGSDATAGTSYQFKADNDLKKDAKCVLYTQATSTATATTIVGKLDADNGKCVP
ncbi:prepilin-type N-terminal cleavage/methylation domain-containing protein [Aeromonas veronii]|uniref:prepilin-type N-terminal cleavage/methylation domain-containing protein n=1 Tax=Aeromonas veronii TaxID=654 RepID=UPI00111754DF|nr:prepilin-type N-terminal cleavage/methylation domain-containing protein [Aeromonas veronii]MCF5840300.1 prepilin-type N-terminal cleavage/methylation domain-containing protein [Aeromonas veronii]MCF5887131.1 prepilin-type N-terminal cleavage/methylation domain-containing protein [Aeromonas veronii]MDO2436924.1 prepilin-type N-terminal cleavage/methylation domain-containing protein [Aeromonas veronii]